MYCEIIPHAKLPILLRNCGQEIVSEKYLNLLDASISIVTPNKKANSSSIEVYNNIIYLVGALNDDVNPDSYFVLKIDTNGSGSRLQVHNDGRLRVCTRKMGVFPSSRNVLVVVESDSLTLKQ